MCAQSLTMSVSVTDGVSNMICSPTVSMYLSRELHNVIMQLTQTRNGDGDRIWEKIPDG